MARPILVPCLILALLAAGCAGRQEVRPSPDRESGNAFGERPVEPVRQRTWLEDHPVIKTTGVVVGVTVLVTVVLIAAFAVGLAVTGHAAHGDGPGIGGPPAPYR